MTGETRYQEPQLFRIVYTSRLTTDSKDDAEIALQRIFKESEETNEQMNICSMIYCNLNTFNVVQLLEGPVDVVNSLFKKIAQDTRHTRVSRVFSDRIVAEDKWYRKVGLSYGTQEDWNLLKKNLAELKPQASFSDVKTIDLEMIDRLPIAGDLDLSLIRLVYHSDFKEKNEFRAFYVMQEIVEKAQLKNEKLLIGGVMFMNRNTLDVFQCLEGPSNAVKTLYCAIENDSRHANVETILLQSADKRRYRTWGMVWASEEARKELMDSLPSSVLSKYKAKLSSF